MAIVRAGPLHRWSGQGRIGVDGIVGTDLPFFVLC
jgi:hypothetical protein